MNIIENSKIKIDVLDCIKCGECVKDCVQFLFSIEEDSLQIADSFENDCIECGHCEAVCPENVIQLKFHEGVDLVNISTQEEIPSYSKFLNLALRRRSIRRFDNKAIPKDLMEKLLVVGKYSPTGVNSENIYFTVIQDRSIVAKISKHITNKRINFIKTLEDPKSRVTLLNVMSQNELTKAIENLPKYKRRHEAIANGRDFWCWGGELLIIHGDKTIGGILSNGALAAAHIMLAAETLGLGSCSLGYLTYFINQSHSLRKMIKIPENHDVGYSLSLGYPDVNYKRIPTRKPLRVQWI